MTISKSILGLCAALGAVFSAHGGTVDEIMATVDKEAILRSDVLEEIGPLLRDMRQSMAPEAFEAEADKVMREALDKAIENKILFREATAAGAKIEDKDVEERLDKVRSQYKTAEEFNKVVAESGETMSDFRERLRKQILAISFGVAKHRQFEKDAVVSESEISQYYQDHQSEWSRPERVKARRIFLQAPKDAAVRDKAKAQLAALKDELGLGADFGELAKQHSQGPEAADGGLMGWVSRGDLVGDLDAALFALAPGSTSDVLETEFGVLILKVEEKQEAGSAPYDEVRNEIEPILRRKYADERFSTWMAELRKKSLVREFL